jgi:putative membrane protein
MITAALALAGLAALLHVYIFVLESLRWTAPRTRAVFGTTAEEAQATKMLAFNQGFYNLFLAVVTAVGIVAVVLGHRSVGAALSCFFWRCPRSRLLRELREVQRRRTSRRPLVGAV